MKKKTIAQIVVLLLILAMAVGTFVVLLVSGKNKTVEAKKEEGELILLSEVTTCEVFQNVPAWVAEGTKMGEAVEYGQKVFIIDVNGATLDQYKEYLTLLERAGFKKHSDNGEEGMEGYVYAAAYTKDALAVTVSFSVRIGKAYITASENMPLSDYLIYNAENAKPISADKKTKVHMVQQNANGNSFIFELKNGKYVIHDGGGAADAPYLLDYLEDLTPGNEKPIIEGWFISHPHGDHYGALEEISKDPEQAARLIVNGVYFVEPSNEQMYRFVSMESDYNKGLNLSVAMIGVATKAFRTESGQIPKLYRPQLGQRYYFCDTTVDVSFTSDQLIDVSVTSDVNDLSAWFMTTIDGQRFMIGGDSGKLGTKTIMRHYDREYFKFDVFAALHHGINVYDSFTDYCDVQTLLYTSWRSGSIWTDGTWKAAEAENARLRSVVEEYYDHGKGSVVLTFPYVKGTAEIMEPFKWQYNQIPGVPEGRTGWGVENP